MIRAALAYASQLGWPVFPCRERGKEPLTEHGVLDATTDPAQIRSWWTRWPVANVGLAAGFGWLVVDVDPRNGGQASLLDVEAANSILPPTVTAQTGGAGWHYLYGSEPGTRVRGALATGVDLKGAGGYIVAPPSIHPSGRPYRWHPNYHPLRVGLTPAPAWLLSMATVRPAVDRGPATGPAATSFLARCFDSLGWLGADLPNGNVGCRCPWDECHTTKGSPSSTVLRPPTETRRLGRFHCSHTSHGPRGVIDVLQALPSQALALQASTDPVLFDLACSLLRSRAA